MWEHQHHCILWLKGKLTQINNNSLNQGMLKNTDYNPEDLGAFI